MKKYLLFPGHVISKNDGDRHYIGASKLAALYGVSMSECLVYAERMTYTIPLIHLRPKVSGDYTLPSAP